MFQPAVANGLWEDSFFVDQMHVYHLHKRGVRQVRRLLQRHIINQRIFHDIAYRIISCSLEGKPATTFLFKLISMLQFSGTVLMIDILEYSKWLSSEPK